MLDFPAVLDVAGTYRDDAGLDGRIDLLPGDAVRTPWPAGQDVVLMSYLLSALGDAEIDVVVARRTPAWPRRPADRPRLHARRRRPGPAFAALWFLQYLAYRSDAVSFSGAALCERLRDRLRARAERGTDPRDHQDDPGRERVDMSLAVGLTPLETRRDVVLHVATRAEELGYDAFFVAEGWGHDASVLLAEIATRTSRIRIGTGVLNVWGRSAAQIAMLATSLHEISGGRFVLGLGAGSPPLAEGLHDVPFRAPVQRLGGRDAPGARAARRRARRDAGDGGRGLRLAVGPSPVPIMLAALGPRRSELRRARRRLEPVPVPGLRAEGRGPAAGGRRRTVGRCRRCVRASRRRCRPTRTGPGRWRRGGSSST